MGIFQRGSPMVSVKKLTIFFSVFFSKRVLEIMFSYGLERKEAFEDDRNVIFFKSKKIGIFQRGSPMVWVKSHQAVLFPLACCYLFFEQQSYSYSF